MNNTTEQKITTPEQRRAKAAWEITKPMSGDPAGDYATQCKQTSARILNSGLLPALAFLDAKTKEKDSDKSGPAGQMKKCLDALVQWLPQFTGDSSMITAKALLDKLMDADGSTLRRTQAEALAYLEWLARFAEGRKS